LKAGSQCCTLDALPERETCYPQYRRLDGPQGWPRWVKKIWPLLGYDPQTTHSLANCYTDYAIPAHLVASML